MLVLVVVGLDWGTGDPANNGDEGDAGESKSKGVICDNIGKDIKVSALRLAFKFALVWGKTIEDGYCALYQQNG